MKPKYAFCWQVFGDVSATPTVVNGTVYVVDWGYTDFLNFSVGPYLAGNGHLTALDAETGTWPGFMPIPLCIGYKQQLCVVYLKINLQPVPLFQPVYTAAMLCCIGCVGTETLHNLASQLFFFHFRARSQLCLLTGELSFKILCVAQLRS